MSARRTVDRRDGLTVVTLHEREVQVLHWVFTDLARMLTDGSSVDAVTKRLYPRAYLDPTEESAETQWQDLVHDEIVEARLTALTGVVRGLDSASPVADVAEVREIVLGEEQTGQWIGVLNDARLAVGTALEITPEWDFDEIDPDVPNYELHTLYAWMTQLLGELLTTAV